MATFFTDFSSASVGAALPTGWTAAWDTDTIDWAVADENSDRSISATPNTEHVYRAAVWDGGGGPGSVSGDVEVLAKLKPVNNGGHHIALVLRSTNTSTGNGYFFKLADFGTPFAGIDEIAAGSFVDGDFTNFAWSSGTWYWVRAQISSTTSRIRVWADGGGEPGSWTHERALGGSPTYTSGYIGVGLHNQNGGARFWGQIGVGTGGDTAPSSAPAAGKVPLLMAHYS